MSGKGGYVAQIFNGSVQFFDGGSALGAAVPVNVVHAATITSTFVVQGQRTITASYTGDGTYNPATSQPLILTVGPPFALAGPSTGSVIAGEPTLITLFLAASNPAAKFSGDVTLTCQSPSAGITCSVSPGSVPFSATNSVPFTVSVSTPKTASLHKPNLRGWPLTLAGVAAFVLAGFGKKHKPALAMLVFLAALGISSCGGGSSQSTPPPAPPPTTTQANIVVTGTSGSYVATTTLQLTITH